MLENLDEKYRIKIKEISDNKQPYVDSFGRVTYFFVVLGGHVIPIYQPGTIMFETAVKADSDLAIKVKGI